MFLTLNEIVNGIVDTKNMVLQVVSSDEFGDITAKCDYVNSHLYEWNLRYNKRKEKDDFSILACTLYEENGIAHPILDAEYETYSSLMDQLQKNIEIFQEKN